MVSQCQRTEHVPFQQLRLIYKNIELKIFKTWRRLWIWSTVHTANILSMPMTICCAVLGQHLLLVCKNSIHSCPDESNVQLAFSSLPLTGLCPKENFETESIIETSFMHFSCWKQYSVNSQLFKGGGNYSALSKSSNNVISPHAVKFRDCLFVTCLPSW